MIEVDTLPSAADPVEDHADFLELSALRSPAGSFSIYEYMRELNLACASEEVEGEDKDKDKKEPEEGDPGQEALAEGAFAELDDRNRSCGCDASRYPFIISESTVAYHKDPEKSLYTFLALLSWFGKDVGPNDLDGEKIFEEICAKAAEAYLGGPSPRVRSIVFGFPRRLEPKGFAAALNQLCSHMGEGKGHHTGRPKLPDQKDGKLDVVAWREFEDRRQGKLIAFGQCATGHNWDRKVTELPQTTDWCTLWMADRPSVWPVRAFFVPHRVDKKNWFQTCVHGGILFDRCRIAALVFEEDRSLSKKWVTWSNYILKKIRET